jgi:hypothetical protein
MTMESNVTEFPGRKPIIAMEGPYDDDDNLLHAEHFRCLQTRIDDCASMSLIAAGEMEKMEKLDAFKNQPKNEQLDFAVYHLAEMIIGLKHHYHAAYKGEIEP